MIPQLVFLFLTSLCYGSIMLIFHIFVVNLVLSKSSLEAASRHLVDEVALVLEGFLLLRQFFRLHFLLVALLVLEVQRLDLLHFFEGFGVLG